MDYERVERVVDVWQYPKRQEHVSKLDNCVEFDECVAIPIPNLNPRLVSIPQRVF